MLPEGANSVIKQILYLQTSYQKGTKTILTELFFPEILSIPLNPFILASHTKWAATNSVDSDQTPHNATMLAV